MFSRGCTVGRKQVIPYNALRHCEERSEEAIQLCGSQAGLLRCARNDGCVRTFAVIPVQRTASLRGAKRRTNPACGSKLDCLAALAATAGSAHSRSSCKTHSVIARSEARKQSSFVVRKLDCFAALAMTDVCARATAPQRSVPDGQITCPVPITKINAFVFDAKHFPSRAVSSHQGALAIVTDAGRDVMDAIRHF